MCRCGLLRPLAGEPSSTVPPVSASGGADHRVCPPRGTAKQSAPCPSLLQWDPQQGKRTARIATRCHCHQGWRPGSGFRPPLAFRIPALAGGIPARAARARHDVVMETSWASRPASSPQPPWTREYFRAPRGDLLSSFPENSAQTRTTCIRYNY